MARKIHVEGIVQGVGFRPFVFCLASELGICGWVNNATDGVHIVAEASDDRLAEFLARLESDKPPASIIEQITTQELADVGFEDFSIHESAVAPGERTFVSPDLSTCPDCLSELLDPTDRRFHYPFINCTNCGPRFTIIERLPYDRAHTTMASFTMCASCEQEYRDPANRRFHAQPNACFVCGPQLELFIPKSGERLKGSSAEQSDAIIRRCANLITKGKIVAIKGLGGYHLACDATNEQAVMQLRERKQRPRKPLAVMVASLEDAEQRFTLSATEADLLTSMASPIVLLNVNATQQALQEGTCSFCRGRAPLAPSVTCGLTEVGVMLPATPVQHLLLRAIGKPVVMTSGNISEEPIIGDDMLAQRLLGEVADAFLLNNRPIVSRYDDSVVRVLRTEECGECGDHSAPGASQVMHHSAPEIKQVVRRARGYAPAPLQLPLAPPEQQVILATGPEQKSTFCLAHESKAFVSQHLGGLANANSFAHYVETIGLYEQLFALHPTVLASDMHPAYLSTKWAHEQSAQQGIPLIEIQHHHAHIAAVIAENLVTRGVQPHVGLSPDPLLSKEVIGIALDGTGYGLDGTIWGGEVLIASLTEFSRFAHIECFNLPGGVQAITHPLRAAYALLLQQGLTEHPAAQAVKERLGEGDRKLIEQMISKGVNSPLTSSAGRLFDAVSALLGICDEASYEGEPAILLEAAMGSDACVKRGNLQEGRGVVPRSSQETPLLKVQKQERAQQGKDTSSEADRIIPMHDIILTLLDHLQAGTSLACLSRYFHEALMHAFVEAALSAREHTGIETVALSGGVFNNRFIASLLPGLLQSVGFEVLTHSLLPPNDGCISYGQATIASARLHKMAEAATLASCV